MRRNFGLHLHYGPAWQRLKQQRAQANPPPAKPPPEDDRPF